LLGTDGFALLDVVDAVLGWEGDEEDAIGGDPDGYLTRLLEDAGSAYRVNAEENGLEERIAPPVRDAVVEAVTGAAAAPHAGSASDHLSAAWQAAYGLHPDPVRSYSEAIKAVESAAHAVIQPNHGRATLGTMLGEIGSARSKFVTAFTVPASTDAIAVVESMMRTLWDGQTSRHGKLTPTQPETVEAARAGVHLAATLVQWFTSGAVTRRR
jgi:hypothetical protein